MKTKQSVLSQVTSKTRISTLKSSGLPKLKVMFTNADQLTSSKMVELKKHVETEKPHIMAICEVKPKNLIQLTDMDYKIPGYTLHPVNLDNDVGRGVAIYTIAALDKSVNHIDSYHKFEEVCLLEVRLRSGDVLLFGCVYRSPTPSESSPQNNDRLNRLLTCIANKTYTHICIVGDFNYRQINWATWTTPNSENNDEAKFIEAIRDSFLHQHVEKPTRRRGNDDPSLLDLILTDEAMQVSEITHHAPLGKSDHSVVSFEFNCYLDFSKPKECFMYDKGDYKGMRNKLVNSEWLQEFTNADKDTPVQGKWDSLKTMIIELRDSFVPKRKISGKPRWVDNGSFPISPDIRMSIRSKSKTYREWMVDGSEEARLRYVKERNRSKTLLRKSKKRFEKEIALRSKNNPKAFWKHVRRKLKTKPGVAPLLENVSDKESIKFSDEDKANILQKQFSSVFIREADDGSVPLLARRTEASILNVPITNDMVMKELLRLDPCKSVGPDGIHPRMLSELANFICGPIAFLFNMILERGILPSDWKLATVSPIYKKGLKCIPENYRPISLTAILCKLMEKFVRSTILEHLRDNNLLSNRQFGFINGRSTTTQLLYFLEECVNKIAHGAVVDTIYLDFAKAFDTVAHRRLLGKLHAYGIEGQIFDWIKDFLTGRSQVVQVNGTRSALANVISGIPQGSVLGPLLFVIYINDILDNIESDGLLYADDTKIFRCITCKQDAQVLQSDLKALEDWSKKWLLSFHPEKCHVLTLGRFENIRYTERYRICQKELEHVFEEKDLGVIMDSELNFTEHISSKIRIANAMVGLIRRSFSYLDCQSFKKMYTAVVRPHLEYAQAVWSPNSRKYINMLENVQIRATKLVDGLSKMEYPERLKRLDLPTLLFRRLRGDMIELFKHFKSYDINTITSSFHPKERSLRSHKFQLHERRAIDGVRGFHNKSFYHRTIKTWNRLPSWVVDSKNINSFKNNLDAFWKHNSVKFDHSLTSD